MSFMNVLIKSYAEIIQSTLFILDAVEFIFSQSFLRATSLLFVFLNSVVLFWMNRSSRLIDVKFPVQFDVSNSFDAITTDDSFSNILKLEHSFESGGSLDP